MRQVMSRCSWGFWRVRAGRLHVPCVWRQSLAPCRPGQGLGYPRRSNGPPMCHCSFQRLVTAPTMDGRIHWPRNRIDQSARRVLFPRSPIRARQKRCFRDAPAGRWAPSKPVSLITQGRRFPCAWSFPAGFSSGFTRQDVQSTAGVHRRMGAVGPVRDSSAVFAARGCFLEHCCCTSSPHCCFSFMCPSRFLRAVRLVVFRGGVPAGRACVRCVSRVGTFTPAQARPARFL